MHKNKFTLRTRRSIVVCFLSVLTVGATIAMPKTALAACNAPNPSYGVATMQLNVPTTTDYKVWSHMNAPDSTNDSFMMEVDNGACYIVGDGNIPANTWTWVNHQNGSLSSKIILPLSAGAHTIKLIGREPSVKIDRILAASDQNCVPSGNGDNCTTTADTVRPVVSITAPSDGSTVNGSTLIQANASDNTGISKVEFYIQDKLVVSDTSAPYQYNWDVSSLTNDTYTLSVKAYDIAGNQSTDSRAVKVNNGDTQPPSSPRNLTGNALGIDKVAMNWQASSDNAGTAKYRVVRDNTVIATVSTNNYTDTTVAAGTKYTYYVVALDNSNNISQASNTITVTTPKPSVVDTQAPSTPSDVVATAISPSQINVAWKPSTDNIGVKGYDIYRAQGNGTNTKIATTTNTSYGDGGLPSNTTYTYYVIARDAAGNTSHASPKVSATTAQAPSQHRTSVLRGSVHARNGRPITGAKITLFTNGKRYQATTNWRGRYIMSNIPSGSYEVRYRANGYDQTSKDVRLFPGKTKWQDITLHRR